MQVVSTAAPAADTMPFKGEQVHWWQSGFMWMVLGGPAVVVVAGLVTLWLAVRAPDPVVDANYYQHGIEINKLLEARELAEAARQAEAAQGNYRPALEERNHAATPQEDRQR